MKTSKEQGLARRQACKAPSSGSECLKKEYHEKDHGRPSASGKHGRIPEEDIARLRDMMPTMLKNVFGVEGINRNFRCVFPDHEDRNPSMSYDPRSNRVFCFGCGRSADVFDLARIATNATSFPEQYEAVMRLLALPQPPAFGACPPSKDKAKPSPISLGDLTDAAIRACADLLSPEAAAARRLLEGRGFDPAQLMARYGVGWTPHPARLDRKAFGHARQDPHGFITIPFPDGPDATSHHYAVVRPVSETGKGPKELKPRGVSCPLFFEHLLLGENDIVYITEGPLDAMALSVLLDGAPVAALCGSNVARLRQVLSAAEGKTIPSIGLAFDDDKAGHEMACKAACILDELRIPHFSVEHYPFDAKDPNEALQALREGGKQ